MQYLVLPLHQSSMYKKIAIDLALIYIEWQYQEIKEKLEKETDVEKKLAIINQPLTEQSKDIREIFVNFFIKLAINSCQDKEEKENITRKALYLLKKWLIISPGTQIKYNAIEKFLNGIQNSVSSGYFRDGIVYTYLQLSNFYRIKTSPASLSLWSSQPLLNLTGSKMYLYLTLSYPLDPK